MASDSSYYRSSIFLLFLAPALGGFLFGYDIGGTSYAILQLAALDVDSTVSLYDNPLKTGWFVSAPSAGALLGTAFLVYIDQVWQATTTSNSDKKKKSKSWMKRSKWFSPIGRKKELLYAGFLYALGGSFQYTAASMAFVPDPIKFSTVVLGRWIYGAGIGFAMHGGPTYLAETTPPSVRGMVVGAKEIAIVLGILCGYVVGDNFCIPHAEEFTDSNNNNGWANVCGLTIPGAIFMIAFSMILPESARYLACGNHYRSIRENYRSKQATEEDRNLQTMQAEIKQQISSEVLDSLSFVWHPKRAQEEHTMLMEIYSKHEQSTTNNNNSQSSSSQQSSLSLSALFSDPSVRPALKAGLGLVILQQITGQPSVLSYATPILAKVPGLGASASMFLAAFKVLATTLSVILVEKNGRKTLLQAGCSLMLAALMVLAVAFRESSNEEPNNSTAELGSDSLDANSIFALLGMFAYIAGYQIGFGPITWLMISEVFPQNVRSTTVALSVQANFALNALVQLLVPLLQSSLGMSMTFAMFGCLTAYSLWFVQHNVPETKGLTLEEIEEKLGLMADNADFAASRIRDDDLFLDPEGEVETTARRRTSHGVIGGTNDDERMRLLPA